MKRWIVILVSILMLLSACSSALETQPIETQAPETQPSETQTPEVNYDLSCDMTQLDFFGDLFDEGSPEEWDAMGQYTILLEGLDTPVLVDMNGRNVLAVHAYGQTAELGADGELFQDCTPVDIESIDGAVLVDISWDYNGKTYLLTEGKCYAFAPEEDISTQLFAREDGSLAYRRYWGEYVTSFDQWDTAPLDLCTARDQFLYETGSAEIADGEVILTAEKTVTVSDEYDLDAMFAEAKTQGLYEEYETADALLAANQAG